MSQNKGFISGFSEKERDRRWQKAREFMGEKGLDALLVVGMTSYPFGQYLSNEGPGSSVIFPLEGEPVLLARGIGSVIALRPDTPEEERPWMKDVRAGCSRYDHSNDIGGKRTGTRPHWCGRYRFYRDSLGRLDSLRNLGAGGQEVTRLSL